MKVIGYYSGAGSITKFGPGPDNHQYDELNNDYDFSYTPMGIADKISKQHDLIQETTISQPQGFLEDTRTASSDMLLLFFAKKNLGQGNSYEDNDRIFKIKIFFSALLSYKAWKIGEMKRQNFDHSKPENQLRIILSDWHPTTKTQKSYKMNLIRSGGDAKENERNTVKEVPKKLL
jgi:hypothetical protein